MTLKTIRPFLALILTFALLLGHMTHGAQAIAMDARMTFTATEASVSAECDGCADGDSSMVAIPAAEFILPAFPLITFDQVATPSGTEWIAPPIASPPKFVIRT